MKCPKCKGELKYIASSDSCYCPACKTISIKLEGEMKYAIKVLKTALSEKPKKLITPKGRAELTAALSLLEGASEWWACPGADIITKEPPDKEDCQTCVKHACPGPVKYLIAKGGM